MNEIIATS